MDARCSGVLGSIQGSLRRAGDVEIGRVQAIAAVAGEAAMGLVGLAAVAAARPRWVDMDLRAACMSNSLFVLCLPL